VCLKNESETLPISVIVTLQESRQDFFCLPVIRAIVENRPAEIIIELGPGGASEKRNRGWRKATQPFLFFCDDDVVLHQDALRRLYQAIKEDLTVGVAYGHYRVVHAGGECKVPDGKIIVAEPFTWKHLRGRNSISVMSLMRAPAFRGWDEHLRSFIDWDCWLTMLEADWRGVLVDDVLFDAHYLDRGISAQDYGPASSAYIRRKHHL
jgi:glycosyltransferase involved in cell wall biosynthesis